MTTTPTHRARATATVLTGLLVALSVLLGTAGPARATSHDVVIRQYAYSPPSLTVRQGDAVTWTNEDSVAHDVTATSGPTTFHSPMLAKGQSWTYTFATAGSYGYVCSVHPDMIASVTVTPRPAATAPAPPAGPTRSPAQSPAQHAPAVVPPPSSQPSQGAGTRAHGTTAPAPAPSGATVAAPEETQQVSPAAAPAATLDPLLIVAGASTAVMVFCLLLMTSRPVARPAPAVAEEG